MCSSDLITIRNYTPQQLAALEGAQDVYLVQRTERKSVEWGKRVDLGGRRIIKKKTPRTKTT